MQTVGIVLNVGADNADDFEFGFREQEPPATTASQRNSTCSSVESKS